MDQQIESINSLTTKLKCALTHNMDVCGNGCTICKGKDFAEIRLNLVKELETLVDNYQAYSEFYAEIGHEIGKQFGVKKQSKTAEEMFEELEYFKKIDNEHYLHYETNNRDGIFSEYMVVFDKRFKTYFAQCYDEPMNIDIDTQKAINKQLQELGWI